MAGRLNRKERLEERLSNLEEWEVAVREDLDFRLVHVSPRPDNKPLPAEPRINCRPLANLGYIANDVGRGYVALHPIRYWYQYVRQEESKLYVLLYDYSDRDRLANLLSLKASDFNSPAGEGHEVESLSRKIAASLLWTELYRDIEEVYTLYAQLRTTNFLPEEILSNKDQLRDIVKTVSSMIPYRIADKLTPKLFSV